MSTVLPVSKMNRRNRAIRKKKCSYYRMRPGELQEGANRAAIPEIPCSEDKEMPRTMAGLVSFGLEGCVRYGSRW